MGAVVLDMSMSLDGMADVARRVPASDHDGGILVAYSCEREGAAVGVSGR